MIANVNFRGNCNLLNSIISSDEISGIRGIKTSSPAKFPENIEIRNRKKMSFKTIPVKMVASIV